MVGSKFGKGDCSCQSRKVTSLLRIVRKKNGYTGCRRGFRFFERGDLRSFFDLGELCACVKIQGHFTSQEG